MGTAQERGLVRLRLSLGWSCKAAVPLSPMFMVTSESPLYNVSMIMPVE